MIVPGVFAFFAASYLSLAQRYWQTFLTVVCIVEGAVLFSAAWLSYKTEPSFDLEKWCLSLLLTLAIGALVPLRFFNAVGLGVFAAAFTYLFLILTNQLLLSTAWMQSQIAVALFVFCAVAYFREQQLWAFFQSTEAQRAARTNTAN
jgi:hypothetical protein